MCTQWVHNDIIDPTTKQKELGFMARDKLIKIRANDYEKAIVSVLLSKANENSISLLTESDVVRIALDEMSKKYLTAVELKDLKQKYQ